MTPQPTLFDHLLVWGTFVGPLVIWVPLMIAMGDDPTLPEAFIYGFLAVWGLTIVAVSLATGFFIHRPWLEWMAFARTTHRNEAPVFYAMHVLGFLLLACFGAYGLVGGL